LLLNNPNSANPGFVDEHSVFPLFHYSITVVNKTRLPVPNKKIGRLANLQSQTKWDFIMLAQHPDTADVARRLEHTSLYSVAEKYQNLSVSS
jgi:hypothetical protein